MCKSSVAISQLDDKSVEEYLGCSECKSRCPDLMYANELIWQIWILVNTQWRVTFGAMIGLDYNALKVVTDTLDVTLTPGILQAIKALEMWTLDYQAKEQQRKMKEQNKSTKTPYINKPRRR